MSSDRWAALLEDELVGLGLPPGRARQLAEETTQQAAECATEPGRLFGPAHLYARHLVSELNVGQPAGGPGSGGPGSGG